MTEKQENFYLISTPIKKLLFKFAIPCILSMLVSALYNIVDQIFIGNSIAGTSGIMATTLVYPFTVIALSIGLLIGDGATALFSISLGAKDTKTSQKCIGNAIIVLIIFSILITLLGYIFMNPLLNIMGINGYDLNCQTFTRQYLQIILLGLPFFILSCATSSMIRADGAPTYSMFSSIFGAIINLILDPILIFGCNMGIKGAAIATIIGQIASALACFLYFRKPKLIEFTKESFILDQKVISKILKLGISSFITQISIAIVTIVANNVIGTIGGANATDAGGAIGIAFKIFGIVISFCIGLSVGGQPIIGYNYGAKQYKRVLETLKYIIICNVIIGLIATLIFEFFPNIIVSIFGGHANDLTFYQNYAAKCFQIYLGGILFCCIQKASCIFLQSIDRPYKSMILSLTRDVILLIPGIIILGLFGNLNSMLWAGLIADVGAFIVTVIFVSIECHKFNTKTNPVTTKTNKINNFVITIGREYGSGGKYIGEQLAKRFNIKCYDNELLEKVSENYDINIETLKKVDEKEKSSFWYSFATNYVFNKNELSPISPSDNLFLKQAQVIEKLAQSESCIIIGRCSDYILKNYPNVIRLFIYSNNFDFKINRKKDFENLSFKEAKQKITKIDKERSTYYKHFTSNEWGNKENYDLCLDPSILGIEKTIDILEEYIKIKISKKK